MSTLTSTYSPGFDQAPGVRWVSLRGLA